MSLGKIDVAVQSFRKPESLAYTLLSLHARCADRIDTVHVFDDSGDDGALDFLADPALRDKLSPWTLRLGRSRRPTGWSRLLITPKMRQYKRRYSLAGRLKALIRTRILGRKDPIGDPANQVDEQDIRYQWALNGTDKAHLLIIHDDVRFEADVVGNYLERFAADPRLAVVGQLGQCWRCGNQGRCDPEAVMRGEFPPLWPLTPVQGQEASFPQRRQRDCRINEWCCMVSVAAARNLSEDGIYFGNYEEGDVAAFWFAEIVRRGFHFQNDFPAGERDAWYVHGWQGHSGHSVWVDQGLGRKTYRRDEIVSLLLTDFGYRFPVSAVNSPRPEGR